MTDTVTIVFPGYMVQVVYAVGVLVSVALVVEIAIRVFDWMARNTGPGAQDSVPLWKWEYHDDGRTIERTETDDSE